jgi:hypothetical protein
LVAVVVVVVHKIPVVVQTQAQEEQPHLTLAVLGLLPRLADLVAKAKMQTLPEVLGLLVMRLEIRVAVEKVPQAIHPEQQDVEDK